MIALFGCYLHANSFKWTETGYFSSVVVFEYPVGGGGCGQGGGGREKEREKILKNILILMSFK